MSNLPPPPAPDREKVLVYKDDVLSLQARNQEKTEVLNELQTQINRLLSQFLNENGEMDTTKIMKLVALVNPLNFASKSSKEKQLKEIINIDGILAANLRAVKALENERTK